jgi:putative transcriptional regulator
LVTKFKVPAASVKFGSVPEEKASGKGVYAGHQINRKAKEIGMSKISPVGSEILEGLREALAHASGEKVRGTVVHQVDIDDVDAKSIRATLKLTQEQMAMVMGTSVSGYRKWEQGERRPSGAARTLLTVMEKEPEAVLRALKDKPFISG